jgi:hypothetical protein
VAPRPAKTSASPIAELVRTSEVPVRPAASAEAKPSRDAIGDLIRTGEPGTRPPANVGEPGRVAAAQRALIKLGYGPLKADGVMGAGRARRSSASRRTVACRSRASSPRGRSATSLAQSGIGIE